MSTLKRVLRNTAIFGVAGCIVGFAITKLTSINPSKPNSDEEIIKQFVNPNRVTVFSATYCQYCNWTKSLLADNKVDAAMVQLNSHPGKHFTNRDFSYFHASY